MFVVNEDNSIYVTRGDAGTISVTAKVDGANYVFKAGDVVRFKVTQKKNCENVVLQKDFPITVDTEVVDIYLSEKDTKIGDVISKPVDYWYEVELNPFTNPQTIIGYDDDGAKIFKLHPEGRDLVDEPTTEEDVPVVDTDLSLTSSKPVENKVIARAVTNLNSDIATLEGKLAEEKKTRETQQNNVAQNVNVLNARMNTFTMLENGSTTGDAELTDIRVGADGVVYPSAGDAVRSQVANLKSDFNDYVYSESDELVALSLQHEGYYNTSGTFINESGRTYAIVNDVSVGDSYKVTTAIRSGIVPAILFFNGNTFLSYEKTGTGVDETLTDYQFTIPTSCNKLIVQNVNYGSITLKKVVKDSYYYTKPYIDSILGKKIGKNIFNIETSVDGYLDASGSLVQYLDWKTSDFIDVRGLDSVVLSGSDGTNRQIMSLNFLCVYDSNKSFISQVGSIVTSPYTIPSNVAFIRFSYREQTGIDIQLEKGESMTSYEPYTEYNIIKNSSYEDGINAYEDVVWAVFGDSLTEKNAKAVTSYYDYVAQALGCSIVNYGKSGTGYAKNSSGSDNFVARMLNINPDAFDILTIFGSFNDISSGLEIGEPTDTGTTTICGCINTTIDNFYSVAPYKPIGLVTPTPWASVPTDSAWANQYADAIIAIGKRRGIPVMDLFRESGIRPWAGSAYIAEYYTEDGVADVGAHPNSRGHKTFLYPHFREFLKTLC